MSGRIIATGVLLGGMLLGAQGVQAQETAPEVFYACYVPLTGTVYRIKTANTRPTCASTAHVEFAWNAEGPAGPPGPPGGALTSPNGLYSIAVTDDGIELKSPEASVKMDANGVAITTINSRRIRVATQGGGPIELDATGNMTLDGAAVTLDARANMVLAAAGTMTLRNAINSRLVLSSGLTLTSPLVTRINGATVQLNGACRPMSGVGHLVAGSGVGAVVGTITTGSPTVLGC